DAVLIVENPPPQDTDRCRDGNCRDKQQSPVDRAAPDLLVDLMGQKDGEDDDQRHAHHGIEHRVLQRQPEGVVLQQVLIVLQADEGPLPEGPHLPKAVEDILNEGNDTEQQQSRKHGQDEDVRSAHLRASEPAEMPCLIFHGRSSCFPVSSLGRPWAQNRVLNRSALLGPRTPPVRGGPGGGRRKTEGHVFAGSSLSLPGSAKDLVQNGLCLRNPLIHSLVHSLHLTECLLHGVIHDGGPVKIAVGGIGKAVGGCVHKYL
ncbi:Phosphoglycolate phosphatase, partial [Dysosmobacter welbionis]